ncbi:hypothetical protein MMC26_003291 [Xylographa opegraphella]|nr:hypothetical protein [Xylographa opegraphella]
MSAKHFLNDAAHAVVTALRSLTLTNPSLVFDEPNKIIYRHPSSISTSQEKISLICGGGSGHEPAFAGYVGRGLLTACVAGSIFASPSAEQIRTCLAHRLPADSPGTLVIVMNYTGDVLNFGMGVEKARAMGREVEIVVVEDDVGVGREKGGKVGRRGISGACLVVKACGALAEMGISLEDTARVGRLVGENVVSVAVSLSRTHVPGRPAEEAAEEAERLPPGTMEIGMGIHNEPGCEKLEADLPGVVEKMLAQLLDQSDKDRAYSTIQQADQTVMLINNFGGLSNLELGAITTEVWTQLGNRYRIKPVRVITGVLNGSLNGLGFGISLLKLVDTGLGKNKSMLELIDFPCEAIGWPAPISTQTWQGEYKDIQHKEDSSEETVRPSNLRSKGTCSMFDVRANHGTVNSARFRKALRSGLEHVIAAEPDVTKFDTIAGDGDCGVGLKRGAEAIQSMLDRTQPTDDVLVAYLDVVRTVESTMDGTSGALYAIFLNTLAHDLRRQDGPTPRDITTQIWANALGSSLQAIAKYTPAQPGDRTLMDALYPFVKALQNSKTTKEAAEAAQKGAESTRGMKASLGRTVYVGGEDWQGVPDPGAWGLSEFLVGLAKEL